MLNTTRKLLKELENFVWYRTDEQDDEMIDKLVDHIKMLDFLVEKEDRKLKSAKKKK